MNKLIKITENNGEQAVSARELHAFLGSKQRFADWITNRIEKYGLLENEDFVSFHKNMKRGTGGTVLIEYALTIDCAKELAMVEGNEKGKQARRYFIDCEKRLRQVDVSAEKVVIDGQVYYNYIDLLRANGLSLISGSVRARKRNYPHEFKVRNNTVYVGQLYAKVIAAGAKQAANYKVLAQRRESLTADRMLDIMADVCMIEDSELRLRIAQKLTQQ